MHGILFKRLKTYVESEWGEEAWEDAMDAADIEPKLYLPVTEYPDDELRRLVDGVVETTGVDEDQLLEGLGEDMAPALLDTFDAHFQDDWDAMDLLSRADNEIYAVLRAEDGGEDVATTREADDTLVLEYSSALEMCSLAEGMLRGVGAEFGDGVTVTEHACMDHGADACRFEVGRN